jgi:hypothetical protein
MLNQNVDSVLIGHNYMTFLLSLGLQSRGKKILVLDDDRFNYGDFFTNTVSKIDIEFLKAHGQKFNNQALLDLDSYLTIIPEFFHIGKTQVFLGQRPSENLQELLRKFPTIFNHNEWASQINLTQFNQDFDHYCVTIAEKLVLAVKKTKWQQVFDIPEKPLVLSKLLDSLSLALSKKDQLNESSRLELNALVYLFRGFYQNRFSIAGSQLEFSHMIISLLSPLYRLNHEKLTSELRTLFLEKGGEFKKLNLADIKFHKGVVKGLELESYEGFVFPKKVVFVGGQPLGLPLSFKNPRAVYNCLNLISTNEILPKHLIGKKMIFTSPMKISTDFPVMEILFHQNAIEFNLVIRKQNGTKIDFIKQKMIKELKSDLYYLYPELNLNFNDVVMKFTHDIFIEDNNYKSKTKNMFGLKLKITDLLFENNPLKFIRPKNVYYLGPYNDGFLGTFSSLIEVQAWQEKI